MPKLQIKATELVDTNVDFVSLVKRGANRIPFRITKEDEPMLDLHSIGRKLFSKADTKPEITAAVVPAGTDMNQVAQVFKDAGLDTKVFLKKEVDGVVTLAKADADKAEDTVIIKTADKIGLVVSGLKKTFDSYATGSDFADAISAQSFYPSFYTAQGVLSDCVSVALLKANTPQEAADRISKAVTDFQSYVNMLAAQLPASAFYVDRYYSDVAKSDEPAAPEATAADAQPEADKVEVAKGEDEGDKPKDKADASEEDDADKGDVKKAGGEGAAPEAEAGKDDLSDLKKSHEDVLGALSQLQKTITDAVSGLKKDVQNELKDVNSRIEKVAEQARKTDAQLNGTVFGEADDDQPNRIEKHEAETGAPPLLDTAFHRIDAA